MYTIEKKMLLVLANKLKFNDCQTILSSTTFNDLTVRIIYFHQWLMYEGYLCSVRKWQGKYLCVNSMIGFEAVWACSFVCCYGICKFFHQKTKVKWDTFIRPKENLMQLFLIEFLWFLLCNLSYKFISLTIFADNQSDLRESKEKIDKL